jgi:predicted membrane-bound spermidine synthase
MRVARWNRTVLGVAAAIEAVTGLVMILFPHALTRLLLGADATGLKIVIGLVAGIALLSLGLVCWMGRQDLPTETR